MRLTFTTNSPRATYYRRMRTTLLEEEQHVVRAELEETHAALGRAQSELEEVRSKW